MRLSQFLLVFELLELHEKSPGMFTLPCRLTLTRKDNFVAAIVWCNDKNPIIKTFADASKIGPISRAAQINDHQPRIRQGAIAVVVKVLTAQLRRLPVDIEAVDNENIDLL